MKRNTILAKHAIAVLIAYAGSENADPAQFEEVLEAAYDALKKFYTEI